jgi:hypothetical protein
VLVEKSGAGRWKAETGAGPRAELLHVLTLPDLDRVGAIQSYWGNPKTRTFGELLIDCDEDRTLERFWSRCCGRPIGDAKAFERTPRSR